MCQCISILLAYNCYSTVMIILIRNLRTGSALEGRRPRKASQKDSELQLRRWSKRKQWITMKTMDNNGKQWITMDKKETEESLAMDGVREGFSPRAFKKSQNHPPFHSKMQLRRWSKGMEPNSGKYSEGVPKTVVLQTIHLVMIEMMTMITSGTARRRATST